MLTIVTLFAAALTAQTQTAATPPEGAVSKSVLEQQIAVYKDLASTARELPGIVIPGETLGTAVGRNLCALTGGCNTTSTRPMRMEFSDGRLKVEPAPPTFADLQASAAAEGRRREDAAEKKAEAAAKAAAEAQKINGYCAVGFTLLVGGAVAAIGGGYGSTQDDNTTNNRFQRAGVAIGGGTGAATAVIAVLATNICRGL